jgi:small subunit ribosomal protein S8e
MAKSQSQSIRMVSGKKYVPAKKKKQHELGRNPALTLIGKTRVKTKRGLGGNTKRQLLSDDVILVSDGKGKTLKLNIESVESNPANINYTRRNIITKGSLVKTEKGMVQVTSRPGQIGKLQGIFSTQ